MLSLRLVNMASALCRNEYPTTNPARAAQTVPCFYDVFEKLWGVWLAQNVTNY